METFSDTFIRTKGAPIDWHGKQIFPMFSRELSARESTMRITRLSQHNSVAQGLRVKLDKGELVVYDRRLTDIVLWADTNPREVEIRVPNAPTLLKVWNVWRVRVHTHELMQAWVGNAGILIDDQNGVVSLFCSDGIGPPDFSDLVVKIEFT
jgi:hypothetical protein